MKTMIKTKKLETKDAVNELKHINVGFEITELKDDHDEFFTFKGLASTWQIDLVDDRFEVGAFAESIAKVLPVILWQHDRHEPIGMPISIKETSAGLEIEAKMPKADTFVSGRVIPQMKIGSIKSLSVGFRTLQSGPDPDDMNIRVITKADLREVSLVTFPANPGAVVTDFKAFQPDLGFAKRDHTWDEEGAVKRIASDTAGYLLPDTKQLPFVDFVDGKRKIIPRALNQAKSILPSLDISDEVKADAFKLIEKYQSKLNEEQPKKDFYTELDVKEISTKKEFERLLRDSGLFSRDAAMMLAKNFNPEARKSESSSDDEDETKALLAKMSEKMDDSEERAVLNRILNK